ncbi:MAG TPA: DUF3592 domain-containing protein [Polyangiaceae bacterium]|jgi:hypothetical protein|nr:DUF3592 domain-containing protein [Polyangiaceae bacterium]
MTALVGVIGLAAAAAMIATVVWLNRRSDARSAARFDAARASAIEEMTVPGEDERVRVEVERRYQETPEQRSIARSGVATAARVVDVEQTYRRTGGGDPVVDLTLEIQSSDGPYQVQMNIAVQLLDIPVCQPGATIQARVDPNDRDKVVVLFDHRLVPVVP